MADRVPSEGLETIDATLVRHGPRGRLAIELPDDVSLATDEVFRLTIDGSERFVQPTWSAEGGIRLGGAYDTPDSARSPGDAENRLQAWLDSTDLDVGRTVHVDVVEPEFKYGLRAPGERAVYDAADPPDEGLASIAEQVESGDDW